MPITDAELQGIAAQALNMAKRDIEQHCFHFVLAAYHEGEQPPLYRMKSVEKVIVERLGKDWLDHGRTKDIGFGVLRKATDLMPPDAVVIVTAINRFSVTDKFYLLTPRQQEELISASHDRHHQAVREGLLRIEDALYAIAQTPERVCHYFQDIENGRPGGAPETNFTLQTEFTGRLKMFGDHYYY